MKVQKYYLVLMVVAEILCTPASGEDDYPYLLCPANPVLAGLGKLSVAVLPPDAEPNKNGLVWKDLQAKVENKLNDSGIKTIAVTTGELLDIPELRVVVEMLKLENSRQYVFRVQTSLVAKVSLRKGPLQFIKADVWKVSPGLQVVSVENAADGLTRGVLKQIEAFINAYHVANTPAQSSSAPGTAETAESTAQKQQLNAPPRQTVTEYRYVASKNSKVFHKPQCGSARAIKSANIVGYNSTDEAIKAGKRACKRCKP